MLDVDIIRGYVESARGNLDDGIELARRGVELAEQVGNTLCAVVGSYRSASSISGAGTSRRRFPRWSGARS